MNEQIITIKIGGALAVDDKCILALAEDMKECSTHDRFLIIHGGGAEVTEFTRKFGIEPIFRDGIRMTSKEEMVLVDKILCGKVNKRLVRLFQKSGFDAVGLSGSDGRLFTGKSIGECDNCLTHTGRITSVNTRLLNVLLDNNYLPVIASTSMDMDGMPLNINADEVAFELSSGIKAGGIIFFSDIPGILKEGNVLKQLGPGDVKEEIKTGVISGGMIPKAKASVDAISKGVGRIIIGEFTGKGSLKELLSGNRGTHITEMKVLS
ncbi:MAG: acetylglutamate kinase [Spirochaetales bacterium]|nr:acetylglutamate kinase [Spirochaetales bacterium]